VLLPAIPRRTTTGPPRLTPEGLRLLGVSIAKQECRGALAAGRGVCYKYEAA